MAKETNLRFEGDHILEFAFLQRAVSGIDVTLDSNDTYEITLHSASETRKLVLGPTRDMTGLARYVEEVTPPMLGVKKVTLRAVGGDKAYAMGHILLR